MGKWDAQDINRLSVVAHSLAEQRQLRISRLELLGVGVSFNIFFTKQQA